MSVAEYPVFVATFVVACVDRLVELTASYDARFHSKYCLVWEDDIQGVTAEWTEEVKETVYLRKIGPRPSDRSIAASVEAAGV